MADELKYGPTFGQEIIAAGLGGLPFAWSATDLWGREDLTPEQNATLDAVIASHSPYARDEPIDYPHLAPELDMGRTTAEIMKE